MTHSDKKQELSLAFMRLQSSNDITTYEYFQNLVIYLSAKEIIEERKKKLAKGTTLEDMLNSALGTLDYESTVNQYLDAAKNLMPALYNQFSIPKINREVVELSTSDNGLERCYSFLRLKEFDNSRKTLVSFKSNKQTNYTYDSDNNEKSQSFVTSQVLSFFQDGETHELEILDPLTNTKKRISDLKYDLEAHGFISYANSDMRVQLNREDPFLSKQIVSIDIIDLGKKWVVAFEK